MNPLAVWQQCTRVNDRCVHAVGRWRNLFSGFALISACALLSEHSLAAPYPIVCNSDGTCFSLPESSPSDTEAGREAAREAGYVVDGRLKEVVVTGERTKPIGSDLNPGTLPARDLGPVGRGGSGGGGGGGGAASAQADPGKNGRAEPPPADNSKKDDGCTNPSTEQPVVIATGEKYKVETDFTSFGMYGLSHQRTYRSNATATGMFGNWWSSLAYIKLGLIGCFRTVDWGCIPTTVHVWNPDGSRDFYTYVSGTEVPYQYTSSGSASGGVSGFLCVRRFAEFGVDGFSLS